MNFTSLKYKKSHIQAMNDAFAVHPNILHRYSPIYLCGVYNTETSQMYINNDLKSGEIIILHKLYKNNPVYKLFSPKASYQTIINLVNNLEEISDKNVKITGLSESYCNGFIEEAKKNGDYEWEISKTFKEYVYDTTQSAKLEGKEFKTTRREINKFKREYNPEIRELNKKTINDAHIVIREWEDYKNIKEKHKNSDINISVRLEKRLIDFGYKHVDNENIFGYVFYIDNMPCGLTFGARCGFNKKYGFSHIGKGLMKYRGINDFRKHFHYSNYSSKGILYSNDGTAFFKGLHEFKRKWKPIEKIQIHELVHKKDISKLKRITVEL